MVLPSGPAAVPRVGGRTFHARTGRLSATKRRALADVLPHFALRPGERPTALDLGCGTGEAALALAAARPDWLVLAVDVHRASVATLVLTATAGGSRPPNLRVHLADGVELLGRRIEPASLRLLQVLFPDPWPKVRHRHRRLVQPAFAALAADRLEPDGRLELATDRADYASQMVAVLDAEPRLTATAVAETRPTTFYGRRARAAGQPIRDLCYRRCCGDAAEVVRQ